MNRVNRKRKEKNKSVVVTFLLIMSICIGFCVLSAYINCKTKEHGMGTIRYNTDWLARQIKSRVDSSREQLELLSHVIAQMPEQNAEKVGQVMDTFDRSGLISRLEILTAENKLLTENGVNDPGSLRFENEKSHGTYISDITTDVLSPEKKIIRMAVPISRDDTVSGILYGIIDLDSFSKIFDVSDFENKVGLYIVDGASGDFLLNTWYEGLGNMNTPGSERVHTNLREGRSGATVFYSKMAKERFYAYYEPIQINQWMLVLSISESGLLDDINMVRNALYLMMLYMILCFGVYGIYLMRTNRREVDGHIHVLQIQKTLFGSYRTPGYLQRALKQVAQATDAEAAIFLRVRENKEIEEYQWGDNQSKINFDFSREEGRFIESELISSAEESASGSWKAGGRNSSSDQMTQIMSAHGIHSYLYTVIINSSDAITDIMLALNTSRSERSLSLLEYLVSSFAMAVKNTEYFQQAKRFGHYDGLTGLLNRNSYQETLRKYQKQRLSRFGCAYIDVNGLHAINNQGGHEAGDRMLCCVANALKWQFGEDYAYRIGGDEFIVFCENIDHQSMMDKLTAAEADINQNEYYISIGVDWCAEQGNVHNMLKAAEARMWEAKSAYYLQKDGIYKSKTAMWEQESVLIDDKDMESFLGTMSCIYWAVYLVDLNTEEARVIYMPSYFYKMYMQAEKNYIKAMQIYLSNMICSEDKRQFEAVLNYRNVEKQLDAGNIPMQIYRKVDGGKIQLRIYKTPCYSNECKETLWLFEDMSED